MYEFVTKLISKHVKPHQYTIDQIMAKVEHKSKSINSALFNMNTYLNGHVHKHALRKMTRPITNTNNIDYDTPTLTPQSRRL